MLGKLTPEPHRHANFFRIKKSKDLILQRQTAKYATFFTTEYSMETINKLGNIDSTKICEKKFIFKFKAIIKADR